MKIDLNGKVVLVTGASRGIGEAIAKGMSDAGAKVALHYNSNKTKAEKVLSGLNSGCFAFQADLGNSNETIKLFEQVIKHFGQIDCLVNNAGIAVESNPTDNNDAWIADWQETMNVNLLATGILCKLSIAHFLKRGGGRIINIASRAAFRGDTQDYLAYAASKGGVVALTRSIARGYGKQNIKAFTIAPGWVKTDMAKDFIDTYGEDAAIEELALSNLTEPKDLAPTIVFLASGLADHSTGCTIDINAGSYVH
jgi:3-oxoacyl-[acyl-carrier protein] reductase